MVGLTYSDDQTKVWEVGFLRLPRSEIVLARWYWLAGDSEYRSLRLCAAPSAEHYLRLHKKIVDLRHADAKAVWLVVRGHAHYDRTPIPGPLRRRRELVHLDGDGDSAWKPKCCCSSNAVGL